MCPPRHPVTPSLRYLFLIFALAASTLHAVPGAWPDGGWEFRRPIDVEWTPDRATGDELAWCEFYTPGKHKPDGADIRVATDDGKPVASRILLAGPGDRVRLVFALSKPVKRYWVYFGNPNPPAKEAEDVKPRWGLLMEMRRPVGAGAGQPPHNFQSTEDLWSRSRQTIGRSMIDKLFVGWSPLGDHPLWVAKYEGMINIPVEGTYTFAGSALNKGALYIDGKPTLFIPGGVQDVRFSAKADLKKGRVPVMFYHAGAGEMRCSVVWKRPDRDKFELIPAEAFGAFPPVTVGPLEEKGKTFTADFKVEYLGECFYANHTSHRLKFIAWPPKLAAPNIKYEWDFGDGQTATGPSGEHVFLVYGDYPVKLSIRTAVNQDAQTTKVHAARPLNQNHKPPEDLPSVQSAIVQNYDLSKVPASWLPWATHLMLRAEKWDTAAKAAVLLGKASDEFEPHVVIETLAEATKELSSRNRGAVAGLWASVPADSKAYPRAASHYARVLMWLSGDFESAVKILEPLAKKSPDNHNLQRVYAQALILAQRAAEGTKILKSLPLQGPADREAAISGAHARTIEYYLHEGDWETGEETWEKWQSQYPADFIEGYSVLLRTQLIELRKAPETAAKVAEAFASAVPTSSYAPQLLHRASTLLAKTDPTKSQALRQTLKQKYPEDPLSQDGPTTREK